MAISVNELTTGSHRLLSNRIKGNAADITISGSYSDETPGNIYYRILNYIDNSTVVDWTILDSSPSGGAFTGVALNVPNGGHYKAQVRIDENGNTDLTANKFSVGLSVGGFGQSKIIGGSGGGEHIELSDLACQYYYGTLNWRNLIDDWNAMSQTTNTSPISTFINSLITALGYPVSWCGWGLGGMGLVDDTVGKYTDRNEADPDDTSTYYGKVLTAFIGGQPKYVMIDIGDADASKTVSKANIVNAVNTIHGWLETDLGYKPILLLVPCGRNEQGTLYAQGYNNFQTAFQELHNGIDIHHLSPRYQLELLGDGLHDPDISKRKLGNSNARALLRILSGKDSRPGYITGVETLSRYCLKINVALPEGLYLKKHNYTGIEFNDSYTPDYTTYGKTSVIVKTKQMIKPGDTLRYCYGNNPPYSNPIQNNEGDVILQNHSSINIPIGYNLAINDIPIDSVDFMLYFANWENSPDVLQENEFPSYNGAYQNCTINNSLNPGDGYVKNTPGEGYFKSTATNLNYISSNKKLSLSNTNKFTFWAWLTHIPNNSNRVLLAGTADDANNYIYFHLSDYPGTKTLQVFLRVGGTVQITTAQYNIIPTSNDEYLYLIMYEKDGNIFKLYYWGNGYTGEVPSYVAQPTYNLGNYNFNTPLDIGRDSATSYYSTCKWHNICLINRVLGGDEKTTIFESGKSLGLTALNSNNVMRLYNDYTLNLYKQKLNYY